MLKMLFPILIPVMLVASVWGYFVDLRDGQVGWFIVRLGVSALAALAIVYWRGRARETGR